jgi:hypothetical protein
MGLCGHCRPPPGAGRGRTDLLAVAARVFAVTAVTLEGGDLASYLLPSPHGNAGRTWEPAFMCSSSVNPPTAMIENPPHLAGGWQL